MMIPINKVSKLPHDTAAYIPLIKPKWHSLILFEGTQRNIVFIPYGHVSN